MGIRMALGARDRQLTGMVLGRALTLALSGVVIGLFAAAGATRFMGSLLVDVSALDAATFILVPLLLCVVAAAAAYLPARRACRVDPMVALRYE
jgi:ABC-type antimicrobial peptide transport system permease subunit